MTLQELKKKKIAYVALGCDKNRVDLEQMIYEIDRFGIKSTPDVIEANIVIINTCSFIMPARKEAIDQIFSVNKLRDAGHVEKIIVTGCLTARYLNELVKEMPEVDLFLPVKDNQSILQKIGGLYGLNIPPESPDRYRRQYITTPKHYAYLKIADGCNNGCSYCTIPIIRGRYRSVPYEDVLWQANEHAKSGVKELIIVAQDSTRYGIDLYKKSRFIELLTAISRIKGIEWIRLHYLYPELMDDELLNFIKSNPKICKYIDMPLQHIDDAILKAMNRRNSEKELRELVKKIKTKYPEIAIRSTFIVGFPGETKAQFNKLCEFLQEARLNNVGFFPYYREEGTKAFFMDKQIKERVKNRRLKKIQKIQEKIANELNSARIGETQKILLDGFDEKTGNYMGRNEFNSPEIDFEVAVIPKGEFSIGTFINVQITDVQNHILIGEEI